MGNLKTYGNPRGMYTYHLVVKYSLAGAGTFTWKIDVQEDTLDAAVEVAVKRFQWQHTENCQTLTVTHVAREDVD